VGRQLARRLDAVFVDTDAEIERRIGQSIRAFFEQSGEDAFRQIEAEVLDALTGGGVRTTTAFSDAVVLATGGGIVLRPENRQRLRTRGTVLYLYAQPRQLLRRVQNDSQRPLLQVENPLERLQALYAQRHLLYRECAHFEIDTRGLSSSALVNHIAARLGLSVKPE
jgi:shikimate kinase